MIFTTAYEQYALKAFGVNSVDYLLKPIEPEAVKRAIKKVETLRDSGPVAQPDYQELLKQLQIRFARQPQGIRRGSPLGWETAFGLSSLTE